MLRVAAGRVAGKERLESDLHSIRGELREEEGGVVAPPGLLQSLSQHWVAHIPEGEDGSHTLQYTQAKDLPFYGRIRILDITHEKKVS